MSMQSGNASPTGTTQGASSVPGSSYSSSDDVRRSPSYTPRDTWTEAKNGFKTSEFYLMVAFVVAVLLATYIDQDSLARNDGWRYAGFAVVAYIISRGLAKLGVREPRSDDSR